MAKTFSGGSLHEERTFDLLVDSTNPRPEPLDLLDIRALQAATGEGCHYEPESLDAAQIVRLYNMGLVSMVERDGEWPQACITVHGVRVLEAFQIATPKDGDPRE